MKKVSAFIFNLGQGGAQGVFVTLVNSLFEKAYDVEVVARNLVNPILANEINKNIAIKSLEATNMKQMLPKLIDYIKNNEIDIAIAFSPEIAVNLYIARIITKKEYKILGRNINTLSVEFNHSKSWFRRVVTQTLVKKYYRRIDRVIAQSKGMAEDLIKNFKVDKDIIRVIYNPLASKYESILEEVERYKKENYILFVGRLEEQKGLEMLLTAFSNIKNKDVNLVLLGSGSKKESLLVLANDIGIDQKVQFVDYSRSAEEYYKHALITVLSSYYEGFPNVLIESIACGTPVVSYDSPSGPSEIIIEDVNGYLAKYLDVDDLKDKIENAILKDWDSNSIKDTAKRYKKEDIIREYIKVVEEL